MDVFIREATVDTPDIILDPNTGVFKFSKKAMAEDASAFFSPVIDWLEKYKESPAPRTEVTFEMVYFNTACSKLIFDCMTIFEEMVQAEQDVLIIWSSHEEDEDMIEAGEEYADMLEVKFEHRTFSD